MEEEIFLPYNKAMVAISIKPIMRLVVVSLFFSRSVAVGEFEGVGRLEGRTARSLEQQSVVMMTRR